MVKDGSLAETLRLRQKVIKRKFFNKKNFSINWNENNILLLYLVQIVILTLIVVEMIILEIDYYTKKFIFNSNILNIIF